MSKIQQDWVVKEHLQLVDLEGIVMMTKGPAVLTYFP
jgi:hypothetical protein